MKQRRTIWCALLAVASLAPTGMARADITSDQAAALLLYPRVALLREIDRAEESIIQITNTSNQVQNAHCFYVDGSSRCSISEDLCDPVENPCAVEDGFCTPRWMETDFDVVLTPRQPLAWRLSQGLQGDDLPLTGLISGPGNSTNVGTSVPPVPPPFEGELKCVVVDGVGNAIPQNVLIGHATTVARELRDATALQIADTPVDKYNAIGIKAIDGDANQDNILVLGGGQNEYNGCPQVLIVNHFFDFAELPEGPVVSRLTLVPCTEDLLLQIPGQTTAQYLVFNEFEQRFSTSAPVNCFFDRQISLIDTRDEDRSIFSVFVAGTIAGQTRIRGVQQGLLGVLTASSNDDRASNNLHFQGDRELPDVWVLP